MQPGAVARRGDKLECSVLIVPGAPSRQRPGHLKVKTEDEADLAAEPGGEMEAAELPKPPLPTQGLKELGS